MDILSIINKESVSADAKVYTKDRSDFVTTTFDALYKNSSAKTNIEKSVSDVNARIDTTNNTVAELDNYTRAKGNGIVLQSQGEMVTVNDSSDDYVVNLKPYGKSEQDSTTGAQLLPNMHVGYTSSSSGMTCEVTDKGCMVNGTPTGIYLSVIAGELELSEGTYYVSGSNASGSLYTQVTVIRNGTTTHYVNKSFAIYGDETSVTYRIQNGGTTPTFTNEIIQPMLNAGETALPWEPYTGGQSSPNPDYPQEIRSTVISKVRSCGAQLVDWTNSLFSHGGLTPTVLEDGGIRVTGTPTASYTQVLNMKKSLPIGTYYISGGLFGAGCMVAQVTIDSTSGTKKHYLNQAFHVSDGDTVSIMIQASNSLDAVDYVIYPMLNAGSTPLPYEPYTETVATLSSPITLYGIPTDSDGNFTDENGQQWIADYIDVDKGKVVRCVNQLVFDGVDIAFTDGTVLGNTIRCALDTIDGLNVGGYCTHLPYKARFNLDEPHYYSDVISCAFFPVEIGTTYEEINEWLKSNHMTIMYPLATPTEEDLPTADKIALRNLKTFYSVTHVMNDSEVKGEMVLSYNADTKMYIDNKFAELAAQLV